MKMWQLLLGGEDEEAISVATYANGGGETTAGALMAISGTDGEKFIAAKRISNNGISFSEVDPVTFTEGNALTVTYSPHLTGGRPDATFDATWHSKALRVKGGNIYFAASLHYIAGGDYPGQTNLVMTKTSGLSSVLWNKRIAIEHPDRVACVGIAVGSNFSTYTFIGKKSQGGGTAATDHSILVSLDSSGNVNGNVRVTNEPHYGWVDTSINVDDFGGWTQFSAFESSDDFVFAWRDTSNSGESSIHKINPSTNSHVWTLDFTSLQVSRITSVCGDGAGGVYALFMQNSSNPGLCVLAHFSSSGSLLFCKRITASNLFEVMRDATTGRIVIVGDRNVIVLDSSGNFLWRRSFSGTPAMGRENVIACIANGRVILGTYPNGYFYSLPLSTGGPAGTYPVIGLVSSAAISVVDHTITPPAPSVTDTIGSAETYDGALAMDVAVNTSVAPTGTWTKTI